MSSQHPIHLLIHPSTHPFTYHPSIHLSTHLSTIHPSTHPPIYLPSIQPSTQTFIYHPSECVSAKSFQSCLILCSPGSTACQAPLPWDSPGKNTRVGCSDLLQGIFLIQASEFFTTSTIWEVHPSIYSRIYLPSINPPIYSSIHPSVHPFIYNFIHPIIPKYAGRGVFQVPSAYR